MEEIIAHVIEPTNWIEVGTSIFSLILAVAAIIVSIITYHSQKEHNKNSVRPILNIVFGDYEDDLYIRVDNNGVGPAIITDISCVYKKAECGNTSKCLVQLISCVATIKQGDSEPTVDLSTYTDFVEDITGRSISPDHGIVLLRKKNPSNNQILALRRFLKDCCVTIQYTDIYSSAPWTCQRDLDFFGRTL